MVCLSNFRSQVIYYVQFCLCKAQFKHVDLHENYGGSGTETPFVYPSRRFSVITSSLLPPSSPHASPSSSLSSLFSSSSLEALSCLSCAKDLWNLARKRLKTEGMLLLLFPVLLSTPSKMPARDLGEVQILKILCSWLGSGFVVLEGPDMNAEKGHALAITPGAAAAAEAQGAAGASGHSLCGRGGGGPYLRSPVSRAGPAPSLPEWRWRKVMLDPDTSKSLKA